MDFLNEILALGPTVMMPVIFFILGICFRLSVGRAFEAGMLVGVGFTGINLIVSMLLNSLGPDGRAGSHHFKHGAPGTQENPDIKH